MLTWACSKDYTWVDGSESPVGDLAKGNAGLLWLIELEEGRPDFHDVPLDLLGVEHHVCRSCVSHGLLGAGYSDEPGVEGLDFVPRGALTITHGIQH